MKPAPATDPDLPPPPADWVPIASYGSFAEADDHALVLLATGHECWLHPQDSGFQLLVPQPIAASAHDEIAAYESEKDSPVTDSPDLPPFRYEGSLGIHVWILCMILAFLWQTSHPDRADTFISSSTALIRNHEWWRPFTALFLHADFPHLLGNLLAGTLFGTFVARTIGPVTAVPAILASGTLGNALNALFYFPDEHRSLGASTAVFGALGLLAALGSMELLRHRRALPWRRIIGPLLGGLILLGWMGGGSPTSEIDVGAHIAGFLSGLILGFTYALLPKQSTEPGPYLK